MDEQNLSKFIRDVRKIDNSLTADECELLAKSYIFNNQNHSQMFYRISAVRLLSGESSSDVFTKFHTFLPNLSLEFADSSSE